MVGSLLILDGYLFRFLDFSFFLLILYFSPYGVEIISMVFPEFLWVRCYHDNTKVSKSHSCRPFLLFLGWRWVILLSFFLMVFFFFFLRGVILLSLNSPTQTAHLLGQLNKTKPTFQVPIRDLQVWSSIHFVVLRIVFKSGIIKTFWIWKFCSLCLKIFVFIYCLCFVICLVINVLGCFVIKK